MPYDEQRCNLTFISDNLIEGTINHVIGSLQKKYMDESVFSKLKYFKTTIKVSIFKTI